MKRSGADMAAVAKPRVLFVINSLAGGGAERVLLTLLEGSEGLRDRVDFSLALLDDEPRAYSPPGWLTVHQLDVRRSLLRSILQLRRLVRQQKPDLIVSFLTRSNLASTVVARGSGLPNVISERANTSGHFKPTLAGNLSRRLVAALYPRASRVIAVSRGIADDLVRNFGVRRDRMDVIANPLPADRVQHLARQESGLSVPRPFCVAVSRLTPGKNVRMVVDAFARSGLPGSLVIFGEGPERAAIEAAIEQHGLAGRVLLPGFASNPFSTMRHADFYVSASNGEGFPNSLVEALALGLPAIATNCASGPSEILADLSREEVHGLTIAPYGILTDTNAVDQLADAMQAISGEAERLRAAGPVRAAEYSVERACTRYWETIAHALDRPSLLSR
ncbi:glycosyltransferase [Croceibacterium sp. TMG7-5b_MA50]|uniref:glycosyltransferase n=1 Tax=Croceibacterium sp. TMG7-5b_MA50 TaxID=3121290 RepID=UPI003221D3D7